MHRVIVGGGAALAQPLIQHWQAGRTTVVCRRTKPDPTLVKHLGSDLKMVGNVKDVEGPVNALVTLCGGVFNGRLHEMTDATWADGIDDNLTAVFEALHDGLSKLASPSNVVVVGSIVGSTGGVGCCNYAAAKAGLVGLVRAAANEWASKDICVNLLELGYIDAGMGARLEQRIKDKVMQTIPLKRFGSADDFVQAVDYLSKVRYATGTVLTLAGGLR